MDTGGRESIIRKTATTESISSPMTTNLCNMGLHPRRISKKMVVDVEVLVKHISKDMRRSMVRDSRVSYFHQSKRNCRRWYHYSQDLLVFLLILLLIVFGSVLHSTLIGADLSSIPRSESVWRIRIIDGTIGQSIDFYWCFCSRSH